jgi:predicted nucleic acid-binding protein
LTARDDERWHACAEVLTFAGRPLGRETSYMSDKYFVDTNILMYAHDRSAGVKYERARGLVEDLWRTRSGVVSTQVLQELCVNLRRKASRPLDPKATREIVTDYLSWQVVVNTGESILQALEIQDRYRISFWDALVIQAAEASGAAVLYSEDLSHLRAYGSVPVENPLAPTK